MRPTLSRVDAKPGTKKPDDYQIIGLCIYAVLTDHRPGCWGSAIGGFVCALFVHLELRRTSDSVYSSHSVGTRHMYPYPSLFDRSLFLQ
jgi:hypothetical protein